MASKKKDFKAEAQALERQKREEERRRRDAERVKKRLAIREKISEAMGIRKKQKEEKPLSAQETKLKDTNKRKKKLLYRRARSRYKLPSDPMNATSIDDAENEAATEEKAEEAAEANEPEAEVITLSEEEETKLEKLEAEFLKHDPDYFGFVPHKHFPQCLADAGLDVEPMDAMFILKSLVAFDLGIDYYGFMGQIRITGASNKLGVMQSLQLMAQQQKDLEMKAEEETDDDIAAAVGAAAADNDNVNDDDAPHPQFDLSRMGSVKELDPDHPLTQLISDLALDGADVDLALLKTAFSTIDVEPDDDDMEFIIDYLCDDDSGFVDFRYFLQFVQEADTGSQFDLAQAITTVANQLRVYVREEARRKEQAEKAKERLEKARKSRMAPDLSKDLLALQQEEKRLRALRLKEKMKRYR